MNQPLTKLEKIRTYLLVHGITQQIEIEAEAEDFLLKFFESEDLESVHVDKDGGLNFEFRESETAPSMDSVISSVEKYKEENHE